jgi:hypothetical protein
MLSSELHPEHGSLVFLRSCLSSEPEHAQVEEQIKHLRNVLGHNVVVAGWIRDPAQEQSVENLIAHLRERVNRFETNKHLRAIEVGHTEELPAVNE